MSRVEWEQKKARVKSVFDGGSLLVMKEDAKEEKEAEFLTKGSFSRVYPGDKLLLFGHSRKNGALGPYFDTHFYREYIHGLWVAKWLKLTQGLSHREILSLLHAPPGKKKGTEPLGTHWKKVVDFQGMLTHFSQQKVPQQVLAEIERRYLYDMDALFQDPYVLWHYPSLSFSLIEEVVQRTPSCSNQKASKEKQRCLHLVQRALSRTFADGNTYAPLVEVKKLLGAQGLTPTIEELTDWLQGVAHVDETGIQAKEQARQEEAIASSIALRLEQETKEVSPTLISQWEATHAFSLANNQVKAVHMALTQHICVITGGPGVGKTTVCRCITDLLGEDHHITLVAPTGRAAKRAKESTGLPATTIHRLLGYDGTSFSKHDRNQVETDVLVVDEASMVDSFLLYSLLQAIPLTTKIILVGDVDQLPSVGAGQILKDLIDSSVVPVTRLTDIFRQAQDSSIIQLAYAVNESGDIPLLIQRANEKGVKDVVYQKEEDIARLQQHIVELAVALYNTHDLFDVQVLIPMYGGACGIDEINREIQQRLLPGKGVRAGAYELKKGDKVIQTRNDAQKGVYNGDVGVVTDISYDQASVFFQGEDTPVVYHASQYKDLSLSYAITIHRAQGSEYPFTVIPVASSYGRMLQKNVLYTGITRAKQKLWVLYQEDAFVQSVRRDSVPPRFTHLQQRLMSQKKQRLS